jgi:Caudovirus prohead serine protease/Phage capsid family
MEADFSGYATKAGVKCSDGRTIMPGAFRHQDKVRVPLVWQHGHTNPENVLGHAILEDREDGVYAYGFFNNSDKAKHTKGLLEHKDVNSLSIWANQLIERASRVVHGHIREVSIVLSGANPGALIENVTVSHSDGEDDVLPDEAIIYSGLELEHADNASKKDDSSTDDSDETLEDIYNSMDDKQKDVVHYMVARVVAGNKDAEDKNDSAEHGNINDNNEEGASVATKNVFEQGSDKDKVVGSVLSHEDVKGIMADATKCGSLKQAVENHMLAHGITDIETLFPEAKALTSAPEFFARRMEWVNGVLSGARKTPFSRIKTHWADLNFDEARAKGYIKGTMKKEEFFGTASRTTTPATIYKKQKLDRDDIIDITDFDVVQWMRGEMRLMLDEEIARAILIGDGRAVDDEDKIPEGNIRPIATDDELFTVVINVNLDDANSSVQEVIDAIVSQRAHYRGTGMPTLYTTELYIAKFLLLKDTLGRRLYTSLDQLATELRVSSIVPVEVLETKPDIVAVIVNMADYSIGADKGGQVTNFDDFDIDFNQYKYLIETRISGALTKLKSAMVVKKTAGANVLVTPNAPTFNAETGVVTIVATTGITYKNGVTDATLATGAQAALADGESLVVVATPNAGFYLASSEDDEWTFTFHADA